MKPTRRVLSLLTFIIALSPFAALAQQVTGNPPNAVSREEAVRLALLQASAFQQARINESIVAEDVKQARAAFLPRLAASGVSTYNSPSTGFPDLQAEKFSFIAANALIEHQATAGITGEVDLAGKLRAGLRRSNALLKAARAGTEAARRALIQGLDEAYYGLALAT